MGSEASRPSTGNSKQSRKKPPSTVLPRRRKKMGAASCLIEWLKPDCLYPNKTKRKKKRSPPTAGGGNSIQFATTARRKQREISGTSLTLEEHLSSASSPHIGSASTRTRQLPDPSSAPTTGGGGGRKPSPKRIHPSSSGSSSGGGRRRRKEKGNGGGGFTLEKLVRMDRESKDDYFSGSISRSNLVSGDGHVGSSSGPPEGSRSCRRGEGNKKRKSVRFTLPGDGDVFVFYSPRAPIDRPFHSL